MATRQRPQDDVVRITTVGTSRGQDIAVRQRRYLLSMSLRSLCFVGAVIAGLAGINWLWPLLIAGAIILPYFAVVLANVSTMRNDSFELRQDLHRPELGPRR